MQKLTAEKAHQLRDAITKNAAVIEPTIRDLYIVQALELALQVLEAVPIELPRHYTVGDNVDDPSYFNDTVIDYHETVELIESQGYKVKR